MKPINKELAPIILFIYKRPEHTAKTLEALHKNLYADSSTLYVYADGPKPDASEEDLELIKQTRAVVQEKQWCKDVILIAREANINLTNSIIDGVTTVIDKHGKAIILEDDIVTSPYFLKYCNDGLEVYKDCPQVFSINAFMYDIDYETEATTFLCPLATNPWGWATWADKWKQFEERPGQIAELESCTLLKNRFNFGDMNWVVMLKNLDTWYDRWYYTAFVRNGLGVFPTKPLSHNIGFDGTATNKGFSIPQQALHIDALKVQHHSAINLYYYARFLNHFQMKRSSALRTLINAIKKRINYKNYNAWWNVPGQALY